MLHLIGMREATRLHHPLRNSFQISKGWFVFLCFVLFFVLSYYFAEEIYNFLVKPYSDAVSNSDVDRRLIYTALHETFIAYLKVAFFTSFFVSSPIILMEIWKFLAPGLYKNEKRALLPYLILTPVLFF